MSETDKYVLEAILEHLNVCEKRFAEINTPESFIESERGTICWMQLRHARLIFPS